VISRKSRSFKTRRVALHLLVTGYFSPLHSLTMQRDVDNVDNKL